jgi:Flp pilus assembly protein TadD
MPVLDAGRGLVMNRWMTCAAALGCWFLFANAIEAKEHAKEPDQLVEWPLPWAQGTSLDYDESNERIIETGGAGNRIHTQGVTRIRIERADAGGFIQSWTPLSSTTRYGTLSDPQQLLLQELEAGLANMPFEVSLAPDGAYAGITNLDAIQSRFSALAKPRFDLLLDAGGKSMPAGIREGLANVFAAYTSKPVLEMQLSTLPVAYNFVAKGGIGLDFEYEYEDEAANPLGGAPFPMTARMTLRKDELREGWLVMDWSTTLDRDKGGPMIAEAARKLLGAAFIADGGGGVQDAIKRMEGNIDVGTSSRFRIDPATGIVQWMQVVQRRRVGNRNDIHTTTLGLRKDKYEGAAAVAAVESVSDLIRRCSDVQSGADAAIVACDALLQVDSDDDSLAMIGHFNRARAHGMKAQHDLSIHDMGEAIRLRPNYATGYVMRGSAYEAKGDYVRALGDYDQAIALAPGEFAAWSARCWLRAIKGDAAADALADCDRALVLVPADSNTFNSRGFVHYLMGNYAASIRDYDTALASDPRVASSHYMRGMAKNNLAAGSGDADIAAGIALDAGVGERYAGYGVKP